jgi:hypothetical protein
MRTAFAQATGEVAADPRMSAFLARDCPEIFHSVATSTSMWQADPYDVEPIHAEARAAFEHLLHRAGRTPPPPSGAVLVLLGEAGSGKTHLMRAFRTRAHGQGLGYCGYMQMTTEASNYARYMLTNLIDGLEQPYAPEGPSRTSLARLSSALLESVPQLSRDEKEAFRAGELEPAKAVDEYADRLQAMERFRSCDLELIRIMLHLERQQPQVHSRALMWLRCQDMRPQDRDWIGGAIPRTDDADPLHMLRHVAHLVGVLHGVPVVLLVDQLEDIFNQADSIERFRRMVDAITGFTDNIPNAVVVLAGLEDYYKENVQRLTQAKLDRLERDPEAIRLFGLRTVDEIQALAQRRLEFLYHTAEIEVEESSTLYPFCRAHLDPLNNFRTRDALDFLRCHHQRCITLGRWVEPQTVVLPPPPPPPVTDLDARWNDFHSAFEGTVPDDEEQLAAILANAVNALSPELPDGFDFAYTASEGRYLEVETSMPDNSVDRLLVAVCNKNARGGGLGRQVDELEKRVGDFPVAVVRTTEFPRTGQAATQIAGMLRRHGRKVVVADADWRHMMAFEDFRKQHQDRTDFGAWQRANRPLGGLDSLQKILRLGEIAIGPRAIEPSAPVASQEAKIIPTSRAPEAAVLPSAGPIVAGETLGITPAPVHFAANEFTHHAAFLGGTGSGKTTAALNLIEQLLARGIPAVLIDRKGDLCCYADPAAWTRSLDDHTRDQARQALRAKLDVVLYTPGEPAGRPLGLPVVPPGFDQLAEADRERFSQYAAGALGSMIGFKSADRDRSQRAILAKAIETMAAVTGASITVPALRDLIEQQDDMLLGAIGGIYPQQLYANLAQRLLTLELNNRQLLTADESLNVDALLGKGRHARPGRVRLSIISTRFLGDAAKLDFWVSQLLVAVSRWCAKSPQPDLQAVFLFDEADIYLPAGSKQPATKAPMEDLLRRARSAGVGVFLATQSPGDFDYKCRENVRTWFIGRVKEPRAIEKLRPMLAAARSDVIDKLGGQPTGQFYVVRESNVSAVRSNPSFMLTEQMAESRIAEIARRCAANEQC